MITGSTVASVHRWLNVHFTCVYLRHRNYILQRDSAECADVQDVTFV